MRRADRLFQIIQFLRSRRVTTARWLAEKLEISERTVYRDIQDLLVSGVPIEGETGIGYVLRRGFDLPPLMFTTEEITALTLGARIVNSCADTALATAAESVLSKVETVLPDPLKQKFDHTPLFAPFMHVSPAVAATMGILRGAIDDHHKVQFDYTREDSTASSRTVWPLGLFFWGTVWTLGAWCELREAFRNFRLDRIQGLVVNNTHYPNIAGRTLDDMIAYECERMNNS